MKLRYLLTLPILATALIGCDKIEESDALPITNPQLPGIDQADFAVTPSAALINGINLDMLVGTPEETVELFTITVDTPDLPEGAEVYGGMELATVDDPDFENPFNLDCTTTDGVVSTTVESLAYIRTQMYGVDPRPYDILYRIAVYVNADGGIYKIGDKNFYYNDGDSFVEEGTDPGYTIEEAYYLLGPNGNVLSSAVEFNHSEYNIYNDPVFTVTAKFSDGDSWLVVPQSVFESGSLDAAQCYGPDDAVALEGVLELGGAAGQLTQGNKYSFTINMAELTFEILEVADFEYMYTPGPANGWSFENNMLVYNTGDYVKYQGYVYVEEMFKLTAQPDWAPLNWGVAKDSAPALTGTLVADGDNIAVDKSMLYLVTTDMDALTYTLLPIENIAMIGNFNGWADDGVVYLETEDYQTWTGELTLPEGDNGNFKFRMNNGWDYNLGAEGDVEPVTITPGTPLSPLVGNGKNLYLEPGHTYEVTLNLGGGDHYSVNATLVQ